jgi:MFS transporter, DHA2 family, multidrug resistance protein
MATPTSTETAPNPQRWWILATCCIVAFAQLAEPQLWMMGLEIPASAFGKAWSEYRILANLGVVLFVAFQLIGGVLGDLFGRRRILLIGAIGATAANVFTLAAPNLPTLIVARGLVGILGALAYPLALAIIRLTFVGDERKIALLIFTLTTAIGLLASLLAILIEDWFGWRWTLVLPIVIGSVGVLMAHRHLPESKTEGQFRHIDGIAAAAWTLVFLAVIFGLTVARTTGTWRNPITIAAGALSLLGVLITIYWTPPTVATGRRSVERGIPRVFLSLLLLASATLSFALSGYVIHMYLYFWIVEQRSVLISGFALLPIILGPMLVIRWAMRFTVQQSHPVVIATGLIFIAFALLLTAMLSPIIPYLALAPIMGLFGVGFMLASTAWTYLFFSALPGDLIGVSAGINRAAGLVGGALSGAILSTVVQAAGLYDFQRRLGDVGLNAEQQALAFRLLNEALRLGFSDESTAIGAALEQIGLFEAYRAAYAVGIATALLVAAFICLLSGVVVWVWFRSSQSTRNKMQHSELGMQ